MMIFISGIVFCGCGSPFRHGEATGAGYDVRDVQGTIVHLKEKPGRILTLSMETDEILLGLVTPDNLVGVNTLLDDPLNSTVVSQARQIPTKVTDPSIEAIVAMKPDVVIIPDWGNLEKVGPLRDLGIPVVVCKGSKTIDEVKETVDLIAKTVHEETRGQQLIQMMDDELADIKQHIDAIPPEHHKSVVLISLMNTYGGTDCIFNDACTYAGVVNGMAAAGIHNGQAMSKEMLVKIDPDYLLLPSYTNHGTYDSVAYIHQYMEDPALQSLKAVRENHLVRPRESYIYNGSQDVVFGIREIARVVYGDTFAQPDGRHITAVL